MAKASGPSPQPLPRGLIVLLSVAAAVIAIAGLRAASDIVGPAFLALVLTIAVHPVRVLVARHGLPRWVGTIAGIVAVYVFLLGLAGALVISVARFATLLPRYEDEFAELMDGIESSLDKLGVDNAQIESIFSKIDLGRLAGFLTDVLSGTLDVLTDLAFILTLLFFMALDASSLPAKIRGLQVTHAPLAAALVGFARSTRRYLQVSTAFGLVVAVVDVVVLWLLDIPAPLLWGLLAFITNYIPNVGFVVGLVPPAVLALLDGGVGLMIAVVVAYSLINFVIQSMIQPKVIGEAVGLSGTLTFLSLILWTWVLGAYGALLAVPLSLLAKSLLVDIDPTVSWLQPLLTGGVTTNSRPDAAKAAVEDDP